MTNPITVGGPYKESDEHVPDPTDMVAQFNTSGVGAHGKIEEVSPVFEVDKVKTAEEIVAALDPENTSVSSDRVLLPSVETDNAAATDALLKRAEARVEKGVVIGEATPASAEGAKEGDEGVDAAVESERSNAAANSTGVRSAGKHDDDQSATSGAVKSDSSADLPADNDDDTKGDDDKSETKAPATASTKATSETTADGNVTKTATPAAPVPAAAGKSTGSTKK